MPGLPHPRRSAIALSLALVLGTLVRVDAAVPDDAAGEAPFLAENQLAMDKMMAGMAVEPSGNVDRDFAAMMIAHHQGAIDMARAALRYGGNEQLRRLAQEIIVTQQQEIVVMRLVLGESLEPTLATPDPSRHDTSGAASSTSMPMNHGQRGAWPVERPASR